MKRLNELTATEAIRWMAQGQATSAQLGRAAGGVFMGKTVTTEFANKPPGKTANPYDPTHTRWFIERFGRGGRR